MCRGDEDDRYVIAEYSHGKRNGHFTGFNPNGAILFECDFIDNKLHGHATWFNEDGSIDEESDWFHCVEQVEYDEEEEEEEEQEEEEEEKKVVLASAF